MKLDFTWPWQWNWTKTLILQVAGGALAFVFLLSLSLYFFLDGHLTRTTLFFPDQISKKLSGETRFLPFGADKERNIELLVEEILLGPARNENLKLVPRGGQVGSLLLRGDRVYLDLTAEIVLPDKEVVFTTAEALKAIKEAVLYNFHDVREVTITVAGQEPGLLRTPQPSEAKK